MASRKQRTASRQKAGTAGKTQPSTGSGPAAASRRQRNFEKKRAAILDAGLQLFSRHGLHGTTIEQIAQLADVSKTNIFYYFSSKEQIYIDILLNLTDGWLAPLKELTKELDPAPALADYIRRKIIFSRTNPAASRLFCLEIVQGAPLVGRELKTNVRKLVDAKVDVIRSWVARGKLAPVDPYHLLFTIWATTQHYADFAAQIEAIAGRTLDDERYLDETVANITRIILDGIRPRPKAKRS